MVLNMSFAKKIKAFEDQFNDEVKEIIVLTSESTGGAGQVCKGLWQPSAEFFAYVDVADGKLYEGKGRLKWLAEDKDSGKWIFNIESKKIYHIKCRVLKDNKIYKNNMKYLENTYMLVDIVERDVSNTALEKILEDYNKDVILEDNDCGMFILERQFNWFSGTVDWMGDECSVLLECDEEDGDTAIKALAEFKKIFTNIDKWDSKFRKFAAKNLTELANDWLEESDEDDEEPDEITEEEFADRISISELTIGSEGDYEAFYNDDDMFWGHIIIIDGNIDGEMESSYIAG